jgi:hypothetical protein
MLRELVGKTRKLGVEDIEHGFGDESDVFTVQSSDGVASQRRRMPSLFTEDSSAIKGVRYVSTSDLIEDHGSTIGISWNNYNLKRIIDICGSAVCSIRLPAGTYILATSLTVPSNITLIFDHGAMLSSSSDTIITLTCNGKIVADERQQIFAGNLVNYVKLYANSRISTCWWGASTESSDNEPAFLGAWLCALNNQLVTDIHTPSGTYISTHFGNLSGRSVWSDHASDHLTRQTFSGDYTIIKLKAGENTRLFSAYLINSKCENIIFDGDNPPDSWGVGSQNNPETPELVYIDGFGYSMPNCVYQFSGGDGCRFHGIFGIVDVGGPPGKTWFNCGWGYVVQKVMPFRMIGPWMENNVNGGLLITPGPLSDHGNSGQLFTFIRDSAIEIIAPYVERYTLGPSVAIELRGISNCKILAYNRCVHIDGDIDIKISNNPESDIPAGLTGAHSNEIEATGKVYVTVEDGCKHNIIRMPSRYADPAWADLNALYLTDNDGTTIVEVPRSVYAVTPGQSIGNIYTRYSNVALSDTTHAVSGGRLGPIQDYSSTFGGPAYVKFPISDTAYKSIVISNQVDMPTNTQLYLYIMMETKHTASRIDIQLYDFYTGDMYNFYTDTWGTGKVLTLDYDNKSTLYRIPFMTDGLTRKISVTFKIQPHHVDGHALNFYHTWVTDAADSALIAQKDYAIVGVNGKAMGTTTNRPPYANVPVGTSFFNTTTGKPNYATTSAWVDATGATV